jgi:hypothetical protein
MCACQSIIPVAFTISSDFTASGHFTLFHLLLAQEKIDVWTCRFFSIFDVHFFPTSIIHINLQHDIPVRGFANAKRASTSRHI